MGYKYLYTSWRESHKIILQSFVMYLQIYSYGCGTVIKFSLQIQILERERERERERESYWALFFRDW